jgi:hypothetical protein
MSSDSPEGATYHQGTQEARGVHLLGSYARPALRAWTPSTAHAHPHLSVSEHAASGAEGTPFFRVGRWASKVLNKELSLVANWVLAIRGERRSKALITAGADPSVKSSREPPKEIWSAKDLSRPGLSRGG